MLNTVDIHPMNDELKAYFERLTAAVHKLERLKRRISMEPLDTNSRTSSSVKSSGKSLVDAVKMPFRLN